MEEDDSPKEEKLEGLEMACKDIYAYLYKKEWSDKKVYSCVAWLYGNLLGRYVHNGVLTHDGAMIILKEFYQIVETIIREKEEKNV